jgi:hypothetical protein
VFGPFGRPAHIAGSPVPAVGAAHQMLPIGKTLPIEQTLPIGKTLPIGQMLPIGQKLLIGKMLLIGPAPGICASVHDTGACLYSERKLVSSRLGACGFTYTSCTSSFCSQPPTATGHVMHYIIFNGSNNLSQDEARELNK